MQIDKYIKDDIVQYLNDRLEIAIVQRDNRQVTDPNDCTGIESHVDDLKEAIKVIKAGK